MSRRARRPSFMPEDKEKLLFALNDARRRAIMCGASAGFGTPRYLVCDAVRDAIDRLAEELTGHRNLFHDFGSTTRRSGHHVEEAMSNSAEAAKPLTVPSEELEAAVDGVVALCDGDQRAALRALVAGNNYLHAEVERLREMISNGYARGRAARRSPLPQQQ